MKLGANTTLTSTGGGTITFGSTLDGSGKNLTITGNAAFDGTVGGNGQLGGVSVSGATAINTGLITTSGAQTYTGAVTLGTGTELVGSTITFNATLDGAHSLIALGNTEFDGAVGGGTALTAILVSGTGTLDGGAVTTTGAQNYNNAVTLGADTTLTSTGGGTITFGSTIDNAHALTVAGNAAFHDVVGGGTALTSLSVSGTSTLKGGAITTTGGQTYMGAVTLGVDTTLSSTSGTVDFGSTVNGPQALTVSGNAEFDKSVGLTQKLTSLSVGGMTTLGNATSPVTVFIDTTGGQTYSGAVTLGKNANLASSSGAIDFASTIDGAFSLTANGATTTTFGGEVGVGTALSGLIVVGPATINTDAITTSGAQTYEGAVTLGTSTTLTETGTSLINFQSTVDGGGKNLTIAGNAEFDGTVGGNGQLGGVSVSGTTTIDTGLITTSGAQTYTGAVTLGTGTELVGSTITFGSTVDGAHSLIALGNTEFDGAVGGGTALTAILVSGIGTLDGGAVTTTGAQNYNNAVTLGADTTLTSTGGGTITFGSTIDNAHALTVAGNATFHDVVGGGTALTSLFVSGTSTLKGGAITTTGGQTYTGAVKLSADTTLVSTGGSGITFDSTINGGFALETNTSGFTTFGGAVGGTIALAGLTVDGPSALDGGTVTTTTTQTYKGLVSLGGDTNLTGTLVAFNSTVDGSWNLTITGAAAFNGVVGGVNPLLSLDVTGASEISADITTMLGGALAAKQTYGGAVTLGSDVVLSTGGGAGFGNIQFNSTVDATTAGAQGLEVDAGTVVFAQNVGGTAPLGFLTVNARANLADAITIATSNASGESGNQAYGPVVLGSNGNDTYTFKSTGGTVDFYSVDGTYSGEEALIVTGNAAFGYSGGGNVGSSVPLGSLSVSGATEVDAASITTTDVNAHGGPNLSGDQTYSGAVTLGWNVTFVSTGGRVDFGSTVDSNPLGSYASLTVAGNAEFDGEVGQIDSLYTLSVSGATDVNTDKITTFGLQTYTGAVTLNADTTLTSSGSGNITFGSTVDGAHGLSTQTSGTTIFDGAVGGTTALSNLFIEDGASNLDGGAITTSGSQDYFGAVTLGADATLTSTAGSITFNSNVEGAHALTVTLDTSGNIAQFDRSVGDTTALSSLTVNGFSVLGSSTITTTGAQTYNGPTLIPGGTTLTSTGGGAIDFKGTVDGDLTLTTDTTGVTTFEGAVSSMFTLTALHIDGAADLDGGAITTAGTQTYGGAVTLGVNTTLKGSAITFNSTIDGTHALTTNTAGATTFDGVIGGTTALASLTTDASGSAFIDTSAITTTGTQTYNNAVTLGVDTTLASTGNITFGSTLNGAHALTVDTSGTTTFSGAVGGTTALASLTTDAAGTTDIDTSAITTAGAQTYNNAVTLGADTTLTSSGSGNITFGSTVDGAHGLSTQTSGTTIFDGAVGGTTALSNLFIEDGASNLDGGAITTSGSQDYFGAVTLGADATLTSTAGSITFNSNVEGAHALTVTLDTSGNIAQFDRSVGDTTALSSLTINGFSVLGSSTVTTTGAQTYNGPTLIPGGTTLTSTGGGAIDFKGTVDGDLTLTTDTTGVTTFEGAVSSMFTLTALHIDGAADLDGGAITTAGTQTYGGAVTLGVNTTLKGSAVTFASTVDGAHALTTNTAGATTFDGIVGGTTALASLTTGLGGSTDINTSAITTSGTQTYNDPVTLGADTTLASSGGLIHFESNINGAHALTISGNAEFDALVGETTPLASLSVSGTTALDTTAITTTGPQTYTGAVTLGDDTTLAGSTVTFELLA